MTASLSERARTGTAGVERSAADLDAEFIADGEVRQTEPAGRVFLRKVDVALGAVQGSPLAHAALQARSTPVSYCPGWRRCSSSSNLTALSKASVRSSGRPRHPTPRSAVLRGCASLALDAARARRRCRLCAGRCAADAGAGGGCNLRERVAMLLVLVHLVVRDLLAGNAARLRSVKSKDSR